MDKSTLEFFIRNGLASRADRVGIVAGERSEILVDGVLESVWPGVAQLQVEVERLRATSCPQERQGIADLLAYAAEELAEYRMTGYFRSLEHLEDRIKQALDQAVEYDLTEPRAC